MFRNSSKFLIIPLHSMMPTTSQKEVGVVMGVAYIIALYCRFLIVRPLGSVR